MRLLSRCLFVTLSLLLLSAPVVVSGQAAPVAGIKLGERFALQFSKSPPQGAAEQLKMRLHSAEIPGAYDVTKETYEVLVPPAYKKTEPHGLFIWISAGNDVKIAKEWEAVLAEKKVIFIGAKNSGNNRDIFDRFRLAIDANLNMRELFNIDGRRVYVSGFSGGSRVASMLGVTYGEMFSGTVAFMGVNFYTDITAPDNKVYGLNYIPDDEVLAMAKKACRYALVTGEKDFNRPNTYGVFADGFRKEGFAGIKLFDVPGQGHAPPSADWLKKALDFLDEGKVGVR